MRGAPRVTTWTTRLAPLYDRLPARRIRKGNVANLLWLFWTTMTRAAFVLLLAAFHSVLAKTCQDYEAISTVEAQQLDPKKYVRDFWYETLSANVFITHGCRCTRYNMTLTSNTTFTDVFTCLKGDDVTTLDNHGSFPEEMPGKMVESLGPVSPPYWVLKTYGDDYDYALVYACVGALGLTSEYVYMFSRTPTLPADVEADMRAHLAQHDLAQDAITRVPMDNCTFS